MRKIILVLALLVLVVSAYTPPPTSVDGGGSAPTRRFSMSFTSSCNNNTISVGIPEVNIHVINDYSSADIFSGVTDSSGNVTFVACGQRVHVYADRTSYGAVDNVYTLNSCTCTGIVPTPPVVIAPPANTTPIHTNTTVTPTVPTNSTPVVTPSPTVDNSTSAPAPTFSGPNSGSVGSSLTFEVGSCSDCSVRVQAPDGKSSNLLVDSSGKVALKLNQAGNYKLTLVRNGSNLATLNVKSNAVTAPAVVDTPAPVQNPAPSSDSGFSNIALGIGVLIVAGIVAYFLMNRKSAAPPVAPPPTA